MKQKHTKKSIGCVQPHLEWGQVGRWKSTTSVEVLLLLPLLLPDVLLLLLLLGLEAPAAPSKSCSLQDSQRAVLPILINSRCQTPDSRRITDNANRMTE
jgi:hypothetical protein